MKLKSSMRSHVARTLPPEVLQRVRREAARVVAPAPTAYGRWGSCTTRHGLIVSGFLLRSSASGGRKGRASMRRRPKQSVRRGPAPRFAFAGGAGRRQEVIDLMKVTMLPGLIDAHTHDERTRVDETVKSTSRFTTVFSRLQRIVGPDREDTKWDRGGRLDSAADLQRALQTRWWSTPRVTLDEGTARTARPVTMTATCLETTLIRSKTMARVVRPRKAGEPEVRKIEAAKLSPPGRSEPKAAKSATAGTKARQPAKASSARGIPSSPTSPF